MEKKLNELTIEEAIEGLKSGKFTSLELTKACLDQIDRLDDKVKAFVTITKDLAIKQAESADGLISSEGPKAFDTKPLLGVPYACKDNYSTKDIETTASSNVLRGYVPPFESTVIARLKEAGAVLLGKTNMDAFAHGSSTETSDFFDTKNPWDLTRVPGGSSGGSAVAVAANMCIFATGSETAGSIRGPAAWCGITGLKPTYGRVSRYGVVAMASSTDSPGPLTKTIDDAAYVLKIIAGKDPFDATSSPNPVENYLDYLNIDSLKGVKIGKPRSYFDIELEPGVRKAVEDAIKVFSELGAEIVDMDLLAPKYSIAVYTILQRSEVSSNLARLTGVRYGNSRDEFGHEARKRMMLGAYTLSAGYYDAYYAKAQKVRTLIVEDFKKAFDSVDMIIGPTMPCVALKLGEAEKSPMFGEMMDVLAEPSSIAGLPGISLPSGLSDGMPVGTQIIGAQFSETKLIKAAKAFQMGTDFHTKFPAVAGESNENA
jgi:aspartyl-tRNA(Asn)/glutamyl-tRNA(Gln) amidotransferase subunit A